MVKNIDFAVFDDIRRNPAGSAGFPKISDENIVITNIHSTIIIQVALQRGFWSRNNVIWVENFFKTS